MTLITDYRQITALYLRRDINGHGSLFIVDQPLVVTFKMDGIGCRLDVRHDWPTDLASIPRGVPRWIVEKVGPHVEAAVVHDFLYRTHFNIYPRPVSDAIFRAIMTHDKVDAFDREVMYRAVRIFGQSSWDAFNPPTKEQT